MTGLPESASNRTSEPAARLLVCGLNWIGDCVMAMPALQIWRARHPQAGLTLLVKPGVAPLWKLHASPSRIEILEPGNLGVVRTARRLARQGFQTAFVLPNSIRSALTPRLAGIPRRRGPARPGGRWLLTEPVPRTPDPSRPHQAWEYFSTLDLPPPAELPEPELSLPPEPLRKAEALLATLPRPRVALIPGAARGPSKQWPPERYIELGSLLALRGWGIAVTGSPAEAELCAGIARGIGANALSVAGTTSFAEWAAVLRVCGTVVANDSGGMHLAAALGARVVALYGATDPGVTGPLGHRCTVIQRPGPRSRDVPRDCPEARARLAAIPAEEVAGHLVEPR